MAEDSPFSAEEVVAEECCSEVQSDNTSCVVPVVALNRIPYAYWDLEEHDKPL